MRAVVVDVALAVASAAAEALEEHGKEERRREGVDQDWERVLCFELPRELNRKALRNNYVSGELRGLVGAKVG